MTIINQNFCKRYRNIILFNKSIGVNINLSFFIIDGFILGIMLLLAARVTIGSGYLSSLCTFPFLTSFSTSRKYSLTSLSLSEGSTVPCGLILYYPVILTLSQPIFLLIGVILYHVIRIWLKNKFLIVSYRMPIL